MSSLVSKLLILLIECYRRYISPLKPPTCRFYPSCSAYTCQAIVKYGPWKGIWLGLRRLGRCHPWHPGGYDPVV